MRIALLLSGGVDSSVALYLLKKAGHDVTAFYLKIWLEDELKFLGECPWEEDLIHARAVCEQLDVPLEVMPMQKEYFDTIVAYTIKEVKSGRTPNPDVMCNNHIKFGLFFDKIGLNKVGGKSKFDKVASGHYAQVVASTNATDTTTAHTYALKTSPDPIKDQTYFLSRLTQRQLRHIIFPIGHLTKKEVRTIARDANLPNKDRKDSQGICFIGKLQFREFLKHYCGEMPGPLIEYETGKQVGAHKGFWFYTIGQRKRIELHGGPWYVVKKDPAHNAVYISSHYFADDKTRSEFDAEDFNWINEPPAVAQTATMLVAPLEVKIRHSPTHYPCEMAWESDKSTPAQHNRAHIKIRGNDQGISAGQFAVFYNNDICLGSGIITA